jgi:stress response protein SCP2
MTVLPRGANAPLPATAIRAVLSWTDTTVPHDIDLSGLLLEATGKVGSDTDFVFYNQPSHRSGAVVHQGRSGASESLFVDTAALPEGVMRVVLAASISSGTFGDVADLVLTVTGAQGESEPLRFESMGASSETAFVAGEIYQRKGQWRLRAVGQGWDSGLTGLVTNHGVMVEDQQPEPVPDAVAAVEVAAPAVEQPPAAVAPPAQAMAEMPGPPTAGAPEPVSLRATRARPVRRPVVKALAHRVQTAFDGGPYTLAPGQAITLVKGGKAVPHLWLRITRTSDKGPAADASVIAYDLHAVPQDVIHYGLLAGAGGAVRLVNRPVSTDPADTAAVELRLTDLDPGVAALVVAVNTYSGDSLGPCGRIAGELVDPDGALWVRTEFPAPQENAMLLLSFVRGETWSLAVLGSPAAGRTPLSLAGAGHWALSA